MWLEFYNPQQTKDKMISSFFIYYYDLITKQNFNHNISFLKVFYTMILEYYVKNVNILKSIIRENYKWLNRIGS